jgi:fructokinase
LVEIVGLGEVLWDMFPERKVLGGAPANFAYHASQFSFNCYVASAVGRDLLGKEILKELAKKKLKPLIESVDYPTGTVQVTLNARGAPQYEICENSAWDNIPFTKRMEELAPNCGAVYFGTLAQRSEASQETIHRFLKLVPKDAYKIFDVNLRQTFFNKEIISQSLRLCNILKMNEEELVEIAHIFGFTGMSEQDMCLCLLKIYDLKYVVETKGEFGSYVFAKDETSYLDAPKIQVADTVGAGDAWAGAFAAALLHGKTMRNSHILAVNAAVHACKQHGGIHT